MKTIKLEVSNTDYKLINDYFNYMYGDISINKAIILLISEQMEILINENIKQKKK